MTHRQVVLAGLVIFLLVSAMGGELSKEAWEQGSRGAWESASQLSSIPAPQLGTHPASEPADWTRTARIATPYDYDEWNGWENAVDRTVADGANVILDWAAFSDTYPGRVLNPAPGLADLAQRVQYVHTHHPGVRFMVYIAPLEMQTPDADTNQDGQPDPGVHTAWTDHPDWLQMGLDGRRAVFYGSQPGMPFWVDDTEEDVWLCPNNAEYHDLIMSLAADIAVTGVDGVWFDVPFFVHDFGQGWQAQWPCHCPVCRARFQAETGYTLPAPPSTPDWDDPAWLAFIAWRYEQTNSFIADFGAALKAVNPNIQLVIETSVGPGVSATQHGNTPLDLPAVSDVTAHEYGGPYTATKYYGWLAMLADLAFWRHTDGDQPAWLLSYVLAGQPDTLDVARLHAGSVLAAGFNYYTSGDYGMASTPDPAFRQQLFGWLADHDDAYYDADLQPYANVALLFSRQTLDYLDKGNWNSDYAYHDEWRGMAMMLLESHIPYRVITEADLTAETLADYDALVLPLFGAMSPAQAQAIRDYVAAGGTIVATGQTSLFDAQGQPLPDFQLADVFGVSYSQAEEGTVYVHDYGAGRSVFTLDRYLSEYFWAAAPTWGGGNPAQAEAIRQAFLAEVWSPAAITPVLATDAPRGVILLPFVSGDELVVRVVNLVDVDTDDADPTPQYGLSLTLALPPGRNATTGQFLDFLGDAQPLSFTTPDQSHLQATFDLDANAVLSFTTTPAWPCQIPGDLDCDCDVDILDIMLVATCWRSADPACARYDLDNDGDIDIVDIMLVAVHWGKTCGVDKWSLWTGGTQLRGANIWQRRVYPELDGTEFLGPGPVGPPYVQSDFDDLAALGANYVNISHPGLFTEEPPYVLDQDIQDNLDNLLSMIKQAGLLAVISFRTGPGRSEFWAVWGEDTVSDPENGWFDPSYYNNTVWGDQEAQDAWVAMWAYTAQRYKDNPIVVGYDLMVEPNSNEVGSYPLGDPFDVWDPEEFYATYGGTLYDWNQLYPRITAAIRQVDADTPILIGGNGYSSLDWLPYVEPTGDPRTVYTVHQYEPFKYTHQDAGVQDCTYPGTCDVDWDDQPETFDHAWLEGRLSIIDTYVSTHGVPVAVNEFGAVRWTPNVDVFMDDQMDLFEQRGLNYALWVWDPAWEPWTQQVDAFNFRHGPDPDNHTDVESSELMHVIVEHWGQNTVWP